MTKTTKEKLVNFRVREETKRDFEIAADLRGTTLSGLIHQLLVKVVREEKERDPKAFDVQNVEAKPQVKKVKDEKFQVLTKTEKNKKEKVA